MPSGVEDRDVSSKRAFRNCAAAFRCWLVPAEWKVCDAEGGGLDVLPMDLVDAENPQMK